jgi:dolichol-phosphate mannosyltransferase
MQQVPNLHILVVDDNSPDGTGQIADDLSAAHPGQVSVLHRTAKQGLGRAYLHGFSVALKDGSDAIVQMDADFSHPPEKIPELIEKAQKYDLVIGSRYVPGGSLDETWPIWRKALSSFGNFYARTILNSPIRDITGGFRLYKRSLLESLPLDRIKSNGYIFQVEMGYLAYLSGASIKEIPIYFAERTSGDSKMSFSIQMEAALRVWAVWWTYRDLRKNRT